MGIYFNPSNDSFRKDRNYKIYVDKTELLNYTNEWLGTPRNCIAVSHARRFGKSHAAGMIDAYYSLGCDSTDIFAGTRIETYSDYKKYMNKYNVIHVDVSTFWDSYKDNLIEKIQEYIYKDFRREFGDKLNYEDSLSYNLMVIYKDTGIPFVIIVDEWDCVIRNSKEEELVHKYLQFLHSLFKSEESKSFLALAYITGILPIKKIKDESALNNFTEFTMIDSYPITQFFGFTEDEVKQLCEQFQLDMDNTKAWYNGYLINGLHMYNPNSVSMAIERHRFDSYWKNTSSFASINTFITMNYDGLKDDIMTMLSDGMVYVNTDTFQNDFVSISSKDEALTALIHLGYLGYNIDEKNAFVPNFEVKKAYQAALCTSGWSKVADSISRCDELLQATINGDSEKVAELIEKAHDAYTSILKYNDENSLSCVLSMAYFTAPAYYNVVREMPAGKGFADFVFIPRLNAGERPAMIIELKYNQSAYSAIRQIKEKRYHGVLKEYSGKVLLVGINYNMDGKNKNITVALLSSWSENNSVTAGADAPAVVVSYAL